MLVGIVSDLDRAGLPAVAIGRDDLDVAAQCGPAVSIPGRVETEVDGRVRLAADEFTKESVGSINPQVVDATLELGNVPRILQCPPAATA